MISIIVPNYNHAVFLEQRLESIFNQIFQNFEVILLDDASTDESVKILKKYASHSKVSHFLVNEQNSGSPFKQWQKGIDLARGEYIWIAESDDYCELDFLEKIFAFIEKDKKEVKIVYSQSVDVNEKGVEISNRIRWTSEFQSNIWKDDFYISGKKFIQEYLKSKNVIPNASAVIFKKSLIDDKQFSADLLQMKMCGDWFFWIKVCSKTNIGFVSEKLNYFRNHHNISRNHTSMEVRKKRLLEESHIRKYLKNQFSVDQSKEIQTLYNKWFYLFSFGNILRNEFYKVVVNKSSCLLFFRNFIINKIHAR